MTYLKIDYASYMQSEAWRSRKQEYYKTHAKRCAACGSKKEIHLHHMTYERLGRELDSDMAPLCSKCHEEVHRLSDENKLFSLTRVTLDFIAVKSRSRSSVVRAERKDAANGIGDRKSGERRYRACSPAEKKPGFVPRNLRSTEFPDASYELPSEADERNGLGRKANKESAKERRKAKAKARADRNEAVLRDRGITRPRKPAKSGGSGKRKNGNARERKQAFINDIRVAAGTTFIIAGESAPFTFVAAEINAAGGTILTFVDEDGRVVAVPPSRVSGVRRNKKKR